MEEIVQIFGNGFFPVMMCGAMFWLNIRMMDQHKEESEQLRQAISELKVAIVELVQTVRNTE